MFLKWEVFIFDLFLGDFIINIVKNAHITYLINYMKKFIFKTFFNSIDRVNLLLKKLVPFTISLKIAIITYFQSTLLSSIFFFSCYQSYSNW